MNIRLVGGAIAVVLMVGGYLLKDHAFEDALVPDTSPAAVDAQLQAEPVALFRIVKAGFPEEYDALTVELSEALKAGAGQVRLAEISQAAMIQLRQSHADAILAAPDRTLRDIIEQSRMLHGRVLDEEGREACNRFAIGGPPSLGAALAGYVDQIDAQGSAVFEAIIEARRAGVTASEPATAEDWAAARDRALANGALPEHMDALRNLDQAEGNLCAGLVSLLEAMVSMETAQGRRLRAGYVRDLARN